MKSHLEERCDLKLRDSSAGLLQSSLVLALFLARSLCVGMRHLHCFFGASLTPMLPSWLLFLLKSGSRVCVRISHGCP